MNKEAIKVISEAQKNHPFKMWWKSNGYKVMRIILFPVWIYMVLQEKVVSYLNDRTEWNETRANKILNYYVPRFSSWDEDNNTFHFCTNELGWRMYYAKKYLKFKDKRFWRMYALGWENKMKFYLVEKFELEGFKKIIKEYDSDWLVIDFKMLEK